MKRPAFMFYPGDWLRSTDLRSCSVGARGLWIDMLCLMHEGNPYGYLRVALKDILPPILANMVGATVEEVENWQKELENAGVFSRKPAENGCIYSRRMVRDEKIRESRAKGGSKSVLNPNVPRARISLQPSSIPPSNASIDPSLAVAVAVAIKSKAKDSGENPPDLLFENCWKKYPKRSGNNPKADALKAWGARLREGVTAEEMEKGLERYLAWCVATEKIGTETVMQAVRFFGRSKIFEQQFELPKPGNGGNGSGPPWWASNEGITAKASELHIESRKGESWNDLKARVNQAMGAV